MTWLNSLDHQRSKLGKLAAGHEVPLHRRGAEAVGQPS